MVSKGAEVHHRDVKPGGPKLATEEREKLVKPYLPPPRESHSQVKEPRRGHGDMYIGKRRQKPIRSFLTLKLYALVYFVVHLVFGIYIRLRQSYHAIIDRIFALLYYHHRTPELIRKDVKNLSRLPEHLSVIITLKAEEDGGLETLMDDVAELGVWCASAGIPRLSVYEKSGILKTNMHSLHSLIAQRLSSYFGSSPRTPHPRLHAPNYPSCPSAPISPSIPPANTGDAAFPSVSFQKTIDILLLSFTDGRDTLVDLTRTLTEMSQSHRLQPGDISQDLIDAELSTTTSIPPLSSLPPQSPTSAASTNSKIATSTSEPDLLLVFGPYVKLDGYPPWQVRLTEIFCIGDSGGGSTGRSGPRVEYQGFLRALWKFAGTEVRLGA